MKKTLYILLLLIFTLKVSSTQNPLYTQFMTNPFLINPALVGTYPYYQIIANNRLQWVGLTDAPMTNVISMFGPMVSQPMGIGGYVMNDVTGPTSKISLMLSYGYNYAIEEDLKISMGLSVGMMQYKIDGTQLNFEYEDRVLTNQVMTDFSPDATVGVYLYSSTYNVGIASTNLLGNKIKFNQTDSITGLSRLKRHIYLHGGYKYIVNREFAVEPAIIIRKVAAIPFQVDFNVRAWYGKRQWDRNRLWGGLSFRSSDALCILIGFTYERKIEIGYSYDIGINKLRTQHLGSHELMIGFKFNDIKDY
jgi:type IX secretion system PorP/SprF family membrane protein